MEESATTLALFGAIIVCLSLVSLPAIRDNAQSTHDFLAGCSIAAGGSLLGLGFIGTSVATPVTYEFLILGVFFILSGQLIRGYKGTEVETA